MPMRYATRKSEFTFHCLTIAFTAFIASGGGTNQNPRIPTAKVMLKPVDDNKPADIDEGVIEFKKVALSDNILTPIATEFEPVFGDGVNAVMRRLKDALGVSRVQNTSILELSASAGQPGVSLAMLVRWINELRKSKGEPKLQADFRRDIQKNISDREQERDELTEQIALRTSDNHRPNSSAFVAWQRSNFSIETHHQRGTYDVARAVSLIADLKVDHKSLTDSQALEFIEKLSNLVYESAENKLATVSQKQFVVLKLELKALSDQLGPNHPAVVGKQRHIDAVEAIHREHSNTAKYGPTEKKKTKDAESDAKFAVVQAFMQEVSEQLKSNNVNHVKALIAKRENLDRQIAKFQQKLAKGMAKMQASSFSRYDFLVVETPSNIPLTETEVQEYEKLRKQCPALPNLEFTKLEAN